jgi:signal transduction histidine kinase
MNHLPDHLTGGLADGSASPLQEAPRILVVDDSATARLMAEGLLKENGYQTLSVPNGEAALEAFPHFQPDLLVLDILMPGMDGLEVCRRIRSLAGGEGIPVLFLTGDERPQTQGQAIEVGGDDLIYKPALQRELVIRVRSMLRIRKLQAALEQESSSLRELQTRQEGLFRFIVHDLKSPLQAILSGAELLAEDPKIAPEHAQMAGLIKQGSITLERMVQDILVVCHKGQLTPMHERIHLHGAVETWSQAVRASYDRRKVALINAVPPDLVVEADLELLRRVVLNLLENALKYGSTGGLVRVEAQALEDEWRIGIADQGPGIPEGMEARIFDPFARLDRDLAQARVSSGLGLAFCREVAHAHGGRIWVEPGQPAGAVFWMAIPRCGLGPSEPA